MSKVKQSRNQDTGKIEYRHAVSNKVIANYEKDSEGLFTCPYTNNKVALEDCIFLGSVMPNVSTTSICHKDASAVWRASRKEFDALDRNCNTCKHLIRHPYKGNNLRTGECNPYGTPYNMIIKFHPDDYMGMPCWVQR